VLVKKDVRCARHTCHVTCRYRVLVAKKVANTAGIYGLGVLISSTAETHFDPIAVSICSGDNALI
jgi:hypothetical protein